MAPTAAAAIASDRAFEQRLRDAFRSTWRR
jgi:hypothetical protein